jgi:predicted nucleotidyltransferase
MRLTDSEVVAIQKGLEESMLLPQKYKVYLFGSRVDSTKRGGDIDLLVLTDDRSADQLRAIRHRLLVAAKKYLSEQKVDLTILGQVESASDVFFRSIEAEIIVLFEKK